jgi:hypothetical protein
MLEKGIFDTSRPRIYNETEFKERLLAEYEMLQQKVDTIGGFRITIKGWSVAAIAGAAAASSKVGSWTTILLSVGLATLIYIFFQLEFEQVRLSSLYAARAGRIERTLISIRSGGGKARAERMQVPYTANEIVLARHKNKYAQGDTWKSIAVRSHLKLYCLLFLLAIAVGRSNWLYCAHTLICHLRNGIHPILALRNFWKGC